MLKVATVAFGGLMVVAVVRMFAVACDDKCALLDGDGKVLFLDLRQANFDQIPLVVLGDAHQGDPVYDPLYDPLVAGPADLGADKKSAQGMPVFQLAQLIPT